MTAPLRMEATEQVRELIAEVKPRLRGWLHLGSIPLTLATGVVMVVLAPTGNSRLGALVFMTSALILFSVSALYHRGTWSTHTCVVLRRLDHANIFLLIAGSYTAYALLLLEGRERALLLTIVWSGAVLGMVFRVCWVTAPRWLHTPIYFALGYGAVLFTPGFFAGASHLPMGVGAAVLVLLATGGALYTVGGVVYGFQRPDPWPAWFGFHEVFHSLTVLAFTAHVVGVCLATFALR